MRPRRTLLGSAVVAALVGCDDEPTAARALPVCSTPVTVTVSAGLTPTFGWTPECRVSVLEVRRVATGTIEWLILADPLDERAVAPGVRYGSVPPGALGPASDQAPPLESGSAYVVLLTVFALPIPPNEVGRREFTP